MCPKCGGEGNLIHRKRYGAIMRRINMTNTKSLRQFVFTIPMNLRELFMTKDRLNKLFKIVERIIKKEFGVMVQERKTKKGIERKFNLEKAVVAILHLFGDKDYSFNPHINVLIFEDSYKTNNLILSTEKLNMIKKSCEKALRGLLKTRVDNVVIHYSYKTKRKIKSSIWYMTKPMKPEIVEYKLSMECDLRPMDLVMLELYNFRFIRFWGLLADSEYKKHLSNTKKEN